MLVFQGDGNLVVYSNTNTIMAIWNTATDNKGAVKACMERNGRFVIRDVADRALWFSDWYVNDTSNAFAVMQDDANFVIYTGWPISTYRWATMKLASCACKLECYNVALKPGVCMANGDARVSCTGCFFLKFQDGNLLVYQTTDQSRPL